MPPKSLQRNDLRKLLKQQLPPPQAPGKEVVYLREKKKRFLCILNCTFNPMICYTLQRH